MSAQIQMRKLASQQLHARPRRSFSCSLAASGRREHFSSEQKPPFRHPPPTLLRQRDVKGLYKLVDEGKIRNFTGVDDPYEKPEKPELVVETDKQTVDESVARILMKLIGLGYLEELDSYDSR
jgi:hypothetical protein